MAEVPEVAGRAALSGRGRWALPGPAPLIGWLQPGCTFHSGGGSPMSRPPLVDAQLIAGLPLPLAQLYRRACNAKGPLERHLAAFYLWEAALKLLASAALAVYAGRPGHDASLVERLKNLARPS